MKRMRLAALIAALLVPLSAHAQQAASVSEKQDIAVFALGYYGYDIPLETIASVDSEILGVFVNLGRFNVFGQAQRFASADVQSFIDTLRKAKEANFVMPDEYKFGDRQMTEADFNRLVGAFVVVIPTIVDFHSAFNNSQHQYETSIKTSVAFVDVANGTTFGYANIDTNGSSKETQYKSIQLALEGIAPQLTFEIRKIPAFTLKTVVLALSRGEVKLQLGQNMGVQVGDEYAVIDRSEVAGFSDEREDGLLLIRNVGPEVSTGTILYAGDTLKEGAQLREIPRFGVDLAPYLSYLSYFGTVNGNDSALVIGARGIASRGFYDVRPFGGVQVTADLDLWLPIAAYLGVEYDVYMRRLSLYAQGAVGGATNIIFKWIDDTFSNDDDQFFSHYGLKAGVGASYLITRDLKLYAEAGGEYWFGILSSLGGPWSSYGGASVGLGAVIKM